MNFVNLTIETKGLVLTPITNLDFESFGVIDVSELEELEVEPKTQLPVFNTQKQVQETVFVDKLDVDTHWYLKEGTLHKVLHII